MSSFNKDQTSQRVASEASQQLRSKSTSKIAKSVAGSALAQTPFRGGTLTKAAPRVGANKNLGSRKSF